MTAPTKNSYNDLSSLDRDLFDTIRKHSRLSVLEMASELGVTSTAVRNRLTRLVSAGLIQRSREQEGGRGRPKFVYEPTPSALRTVGQNYADLALALWDELIRSVEDRKPRRHLFVRVIDRLADLYRPDVDAEQWHVRLKQLGNALHGRGIEIEVATRDDSELPVLELHSCPYFELAESDRAICALERKMFEKVLGRSLRLSNCRLDGHRSCDFEAKPSYFDDSQTTTTAS